MKLFINTSSNGVFIFPIFSWDEMAKYDLPATVNKILEITGAKQIFYVGHSQGGGIAFAQLSRDQDFASKIKLFVPLAPAVFLDGLTGPLKLIAPFSRDLDVCLFLLSASAVLDALSLTKILRGKDL